MSVAKPPSNTIREKRKELRKKRKKVSKAGMIADCAVMGGLFGKMLVKLECLRTYFGGLKRGFTVICQKKYSKAGIIADKF